MTTSNDLSLTTTGGYYVGDVPYPYISPYWNPPVYIQPTYVQYPVVFYPNDGLEKEVKELKEEIKKLRKELAKN
jgi:hypothetical protein